MSDITKCAGKRCPLKESCKRFTDPRFTYESYTMEQYNEETKKCPLLYPNKRSKNKKTKRTKS